MRNDKKKNVYIYYYIISYTYIYYSCTYYILYIYAI